MSHLFYIIGATILMSCITIGTRALPFIFSKTLSKSELLTAIGSKLPGCIMLLLVVYELRDTQFTQASYYGLPEILALTLVILTYLWKRNAMLSIFVVSAIYILFINLISP